MSTHKAITARCLSYHQAVSGQPGIRALAMAPLRRLVLSVLFTIMTTSYQTTCTVSERSSIKGNTPMQTYRVEFSHYDSKLTSCFHLSVDISCDFMQMTRKLQQTEQRFMKRLHNQSPPKTKVSKRLNIFFLVPSWHSSVGRAFVCSTTGPSFEPHQYLVTGT